MAEKPPSWKFYHPLSIWKTLGLFLIASIVGNAGTAGVLTLLNIENLSWIGGGVGGVLGFALVTFFARKAQAKIDAEGQSS